MTYQLTITSNYDGSISYQTYDNEADALYVAELNEGFNQVTIEELQ